MKVSYFEDTDTLYIEFKGHAVDDTQNLDENTIMDLDEEGNVVAITLEHASLRTDVSNLTLSGIAA